MLNLIDHLPTNSHFRQAQLNDPEWAAEIARQQDAMREAGESPSRGIPVSEFSPEVRVLADVVREMRGLRALVESVFSGSAKRPLPYDGPITAVEKARIDRRWKKHEELVKRVLRKRKD